MTHYSVIGRVTGMALAVVLGTAGMAAAKSGPCPTDATGLTATMQCACLAGAGTGSVWGTGIYTSDSNICSAAIHAGAIGTSGGEIIVAPGAGQDSYAASTRNGISSSSWGAWDHSFTVAPVSLNLQACSSMPAGADMYECACPPGPYTGSVWGSGPYTNDSAICTAAVHAGAIGSAGGSVRVLAAPGLQSYSGSSWNGVSTADYGPWSGSIVFDMN